MTKIYTHKHTDGACLGHVSTSVHTRLANTSIWACAAVAVKQHSQQWLPHCSQRQRVQHVSFWQQR